MGWRKTDRQLEKHNRRVIRRLLKDFQGISDEIYTEVEGLINQLGIEDGKFTGSNADLIFATKVRQKILDILKKSKYPVQIEGFVGSLDKLVSYIVKIHKQLNKVDAAKFLAKNRVVLALKETLGQQFDIKFVQGEIIAPISSSIVSAIMGKSSVEELKKTLERAIKGDKTKTNILNHTVGQKAVDTLYQANGAINMEVAQEYGFNAYRYVGGLITTSRPQCIRWVTKFKGVLLFEELDAEIEWAEKRGSGMILGTTKETFAPNRGGYRCRHRAYPTLIIPKENVFVKAKTIKEAEDFAIKNKLYSANPRFIKYEGLPLETVNAINKELYEIKKLNIITTWTNNEPLRSIQVTADRLTENAIMGNMHGDLHIRPNTKLDDLIGQVSDSGWHVKTENKLNYLLQHETNHSIVRFQDLKIFAPKSVILIDMQTLYKDYLNDSGEKISGYSQVNLDEFWAEGLADYFINQENSNKWSKSVNELYKKHFVK